MFRVRLLTLYGVKLISALLGVLGIVLLVGCNFLEVQVTTHHRSVTDVGDGTQDTYTKNTEDSLEKDETNIVIKTIP